MSRLIHWLRGAVPVRDGTEITDGQLLERFVQSRDEAAFGALVRWHGPMVLGVCRRVLRSDADAEDAFQATFLVLVHKAASVVPREMVGNFLYGVAYRTALKAKARAAKRRAREKQVAEMPEPEVPSDSWRDLRPLLDQELSRLPDKYRVPVVLCHLEGRTQKEVARQLGWPEGTVAVRLMRARILLAKRLARHGLALSTGSLALLFAQNTASALPAPLVVSTVKAAAWVAAGQAAAAGPVTAEAAALTKGVLQAMFLTKLKTALVLVLVVTLAGFTAGVAVFSSQVRKEPESPTAPAPDALKSDKTRIQGTWVVEFTEKDGFRGVGDWWVIRADKIVLFRRGVGEDDVDGEATYVLDPTKTPKAIDLTPDRGPAKGKTLSGIYELEGDRLKVCFVTPEAEEEKGKGRPTQFATKPGSGHFLWVFQRLPVPGK
jgi:RNA polymerase sigma-70 factor (ECF subfamily)